MSVARTAIVLAVSALALVTAGSASAVTGEVPLVKALHGAGGMFFVMPTSKQAKKFTTCDAADRRARAQAEAGRTFFAELHRKAAPVACEQPPRSQLSDPDLFKNTITAAFAALK